MQRASAVAADNPRGRVDHRPPRMPSRFSLVGMWQTLILSFVSNLALAGPDPELVRIYYDFEVAGYCGLVNDRVGAGFWRARDCVIAGRGIDEQAKQQARMQGWKEAHLEWQNRGLGGFKNWCRTEGRDVAERFARFGGGEC